MNRGSYRSTNSIMLDSEDWKRLSAKARHIYLTLKTSRLNNMIGLFLWDSGAVVTICDQSGYKSIEDALKELTRERWIVIRDGMIWLRNCLRYDPTITLTNPNHINGIKKALGGLFNTQILSDFCTYYGIDNPYPPHPPSHPIPISTKETDTDTDTERDGETEAADAATPIVDWYNSICKPVGLPECLKLSDKRRGFLNGRMTENPSFDWPAYFTRVSRSKFLCGGNDRGWRADFEWLVRPENFLKVNEGKYDNREGARPKTKFEEEFDRSAEIGNREVERTRQMLRETFGDNIPFQEVKK